MWTEYTHGRFGRDQTPCEVLCEVSCEVPAVPPAIFLSGHRCSHFHPSFSLSLSQWLLTWRVLCSRRCSWPRGGVTERSQYQSLTSGAEILVGGGEQGINRRHGLETGVTGGMNRSGVREELAEDGGAQTWISGQIRYAREFGVDTPSRRRAGSLGFEVSPLFQREKARAMSEASKCPCRRRTRPPECRDPEEIQFNLLHTIHISNNYF